MVRTYLNKQFKDQLFFKIQSTTQKTKYKPKPKPKTTFGEDKFCEYKYTLKQCFSGKKLKNKI